jgi:transcriptional regulator with XRE-family HTH domain
MMQLEKYNAARQALAAAQWRKTLDLSVQELAELTGYSVPAIRLFEKGKNTEGKPHNAAAARRYKLTCLAVMFLREYQMTLEQWEWRAVNPDHNIYGNIY